MKRLLPFVFAATVAANPLLPITATNYPPSPPVTITVTWNAGSTNEPLQGFDVYCGPSNRFYTNTVFTTQFSQVFSNVSPDGEYHFAVKAIGINGMPSPYSEDVMFPPPIPTNWIATVQSTLSITNNLGPSTFYALCSSTDLVHWRPTPGASNTITKTNW